MALHGQVSINAEVIGQYDIVRLTDVPTDPADQECIYRWTVHFPTLWRHAVSGKITHWYNDGAAALLAAVLAEAERRAERIPGRPALPAGEATSARA